MNSIPPFTVTAEILNLVAEISEQVGMLKASAFNIPRKLHEKNRIKAITGTLAIEGSTLSEEQITAIVAGQYVLGSMRELAEVKGAIRAYESLADLHPENIEDLLRAHNLMMSEVLINAGTFRTKAVGILKDRKVYYVAPPAHQVSGLIADLSGRLARSNDHPLITSSIFHYEFEFIHPFIDGNGRIGRLWQTLILSKWYPLFLSLPLESVIKDNQQEYYHALEQAGKQAESTPFIHFMLSMIAQTLTRYASINASVNVPVNAPINAPVNIQSLNTSDAVMVLIQNNPRITRQQMAKIIAKDPRTIGRTIATLQQAGKLKRVGSAKTGHWEIVTDE